MNKQSRTGVFVFKKVKKYPSRKTGGFMYYIFFNDGEKSYKTCIDSGFRNYQRWKPLIENAVAGDVIRNLYVKQKNLIDADSQPKWTGENIYDDVEPEPQQVEKTKVVKQMSLF